MLLVVMGVIVVLGIALAAVLSLTTQEHRILSRTAAWNAALPVAEAGVEEALSHLRQVDGGPLGVNGWMQSANGSIFLNRHYLNDGRYVTAISAAIPPTIVSLGQVWCPAANRYIDRRVQVTTYIWGSFTKGLVARENVVVSGEFYSDSFDSSNPDLSKNGQYDPDNHSDNGDIASNLSAPNAIRLDGVVKIYGTVATGPAGTVNIGSSSSIGTAGWIDGGETGIEPDRYSTDMNVSFPDAFVPADADDGSLPPSGKIDGTTYKYILQDGSDYKLSTLKLSGTDKMLVMGNARLVIDKDISLTGESYIQIQPHASLEVYVKAGIVSISGSSVFNQTGYAANFSLYGLPDLTEINITGGGTLIGTFYAPQADLKLAGSGDDPLDFIGAGIVNSVAGRGAYRFHYDEALGKTEARNLVVSSWKEI